MSSRLGWNVPEIMPTRYMSCPSDLTMMGMLSGWLIAAAMPMYEKHNSWNKYYEQQRKKSCNQMHHLLV
jgi:hypothetical protein